MNKVELEGNLTKDVVLKENDKLNYCYISVAVARSNGNGTDFISVKALGELANQCATNLKKGDRVNITGFMRSSRYEKDKKTIYKEEVVSSGIKKLPKQNSNGSNFTIVGNLVDLPAAEEVSNVEDLSF